MTRVLGIGLVVVLTTALAQKGVVPVEAAQKSKPGLSRFVVVGDSIASGKKKGVKVKGQKGDGKQKGGSTGWSEFYKSF